jgi:hypothetical protein
MNEKIIAMVACLIVGVALVLLSGCRTVKSADAVGIGYEGGKAIGRLEHLHSSLADLSEREAARQDRERQELERIARTAGDLGDTIQQLLNFAWRILDENNRLRAEIERLSKGELLAEPDTGNPYLD